jgi:hypothetical protein
MTSPRPQLSAAAAIAIQAKRVRPEFRVAANPQLVAAMKAATASPMLSTSIVAWSLIQ